MTARTGPAPRIAQRRTLIGAGLAFAILQTVLIATFPILTGSDLRGRLQGIAVSVLEFPLGYLQPAVTAVAGTNGGTPFLLGLGLTFLNGVLWTAAAISLGRQLRELRIAQREPSR